MSLRNYRSRLFKGAAVISLSAALLVAGCSGTGSGSDGEVPLTMWTWSIEAKTALDDGVLEIFEEANPGLTVDVRVHPDKDYQTLLTTGLSGSEGPDVVAIRSYGVISSFAESGNLVPLDDIVDEWDAFTDIAIEGVTARSDGKRYAVPQGIQTAQVFYNTAIFDELGLEVPTSWDEFIEVCATIRESGTAPIVIPGAVAAQIALAGEIVGNARRGGPEFTEAFVAGEVDQTHPDNVASIALMTEIQPYLIDDITAVDLPEAATIFATGMAAMLPSGTWQVSTFEELGVEDLEYATFDIPVDPSWPGEQSIVAYADGGWALSARSEHPEEAEKLIEFLSTLEYHQAYSNRMATIPPRDGVVPPNEHVAAMYDRYIEQSSTYLGAAYLRYGTPWGTDVYGEEVQRLWLGQQTPEGAAESIQRGIDAWFDPADFKSS